MKTLLTVSKTLVMFEAQCVWNQIKWDTEFLTLRLQVSVKGDSAFHTAGITLAVSLGRASFQGKR